MKNTEMKLETTIAKELVKNVNYCNRYIDKKAYPQFFNFMETLNNCFYDYYCEIEKDGEKVTEKENACFQNLRNLLNAIGKVNGFNIKAGTKTGDNSTLFLDCVAYCHKAKKRVKDTKLASLICDKKSVAKEMKKAYENNDFKTHKALNEKTKAIQKEIDEIQAKSGKADLMTTQNSVSAFAKAFEIRLRSVMVKQLSQSIDEIKAEKEKLNAERKARRNASKKAETETKKGNGKGKNNGKKATEKATEKAEKVA